MRLPSHHRQSRLGRYNRLQQLQQQKNYRVYIKRKRKNKKLQLKMVIDGGTASNSANMPPTGMTPKELSDNDDLATALVLDPVLGFQSHKMNCRFRALRPTNSNAIRDIIEEFIKTQNYQETYSKLMEGEWIARSITNKNKLAHKRLQGHVSKFIIIIYFT